MWKLYDDLKFLNDLKDKLKKEIYTKFFNYIYQNVNIIREHSYHFELYFDGERNYIAQYNILLELQEHIFNIYNRITDKSYDELLNDFKGYITISGYTNGNEKYFITNKIYIHLKNMFNELGKINYFDKKYNGLKD